LFTYIQPKHRNESLEAYPTAIEIAEEINRTGYETYFYKNIENKIFTALDNEVIEKLLKI